MFRIDNTPPLHLFNISRILLNFVPPSLTLFRAVRGPEAPNPCVDLQRVRQGRHKCTTTAVTTSICFAGSFNLINGVLRPQPLAICASPSQCGVRRCLFAQVQAPPFRQSCKSTPMPGSLPVLFAQYSAPAAHYFHRSAHMPEGTSSAHFRTQQRPCDNCSQHLKIQVKCEHGTEISEVAQQEFRKWITGSCRLRVTGLLPGPSAATSLAVVSFQLQADSCKLPVAICQAGSWQLLAASCQLPAAS